MSTTHRIKISRILLVQIKICVSSNNSHPFIHFLFKCFQCILNCLRWYILVTSSCFFIHNEMLLRNGVILFMQDWNRDIDIIDHWMWYHLIPSFHSYLHISRSGWVKMKRGSIVQVSTLVDDVLWKWCQNGWLEIEIWLVLTCYTGQDTSLWNHRVVVMYRDFMSSL